MSPSRSRTKKRRRYPAPADQGEARPPRQKVAPPPPRPPRTAALKRLVPALPYALAVVILGLAVAGYLVFIPKKVTHDQLMSRLLPTSVKVPNISSKPAFAAPVPIDSTAPAALLGASTSDPERTGQYSVQWFGLGTEGANVDLSVYVTPSASIAKATESWQIQQNVAKSAIVGAKQDFESSFSLPSVGGSGVYYHIPRTAQNSAGQTVPAGTTDGYTIVLREGNAIARESLQGPKATKAEAEGVATEVDRLLVAKLPTLPPLAATTYPFLASLIYGLVTLALLVTVLVSPVVYRRRQARHREREAERARNHYRSRGSRQLKRYRKLV